MNNLDCTTESSCLEADECKQIENGSFDCFTPTSKYCSTAYCIYDR